MNLETTENTKQEITDNPSANTINNLLNDVTCGIIAQFSNISNISSNAMRPCITAINTLACNLVRDTIFMTRKHECTFPTPDDAVKVLKLYKINVSFSTTPPKLVPLKAPKQGAGISVIPLYFPDDEVVELVEVLNKEPAKIPYEPCLTEHWLMLYSVQPAIPENPTPAYIYTCKKTLREKVNKKVTKPSFNKDFVGYSTKIVDNSKSNAVRGSLNGIALGYNGDRMPALAIDVRPHFVGTEHQIYFKTLTEACVGNDENARNNALMTIKNDKALDPLLPHLMQFIAEGIRLNIINQNLAVLIYLVRIVRSLVDNNNVNLDPYLHKILPNLLSVVLCGNICLNPMTDNHFALRKFAGKVVNGICERQHTARNELVNRLCGLLITNIKQAIVNEVKTNEPNSSSNKVVGSTNNTSGNSSDYTMRLNTLYGSVVCLSELSHEAIRQCLVPRIGLICQFIMMIIKTKGSTLPGTEEKAITSLKDILQSDKIVKALYEYRVSKNMEMTQEACVREYGSPSGIKYADMFNKLTNIRMSSNASTNNSISIPSNNSTVVGSIAGSTATPIPASQHPPQYYSSQI